MSIILHPCTAFDQITVKHPRGFEVILVQVDGQLHGYRNQCPHIGVGLDWGDGRCKTGDNELTCSMHGAQFRADDGSCFAGPCSGQSLRRLPVRIEAGKIVCDS